MGDASQISVFPSGSFFAAVIDYVNLIKITNDKVRSLSFLSTRAA